MKFIRLYEEFVGTKTIETYYNIIFDTDFVRVESKQEMEDLRDKIFSKIRKSFREDGRTLPDRSEVMLYLRGIIRKKDNEFYVWYGEIDHQDAVDKFLAPKGIIKDVTEGYRAIENHTKAGDWKILEPNSPGIASALQTVANKFDITFHKGEKVFSPKTSS